MGAASCATENTDRGGCAALRQGVGKMERPPASNAETKIAELAERKLWFDHPEFA
jgi:hypothetical protein